MIDYHNPTSSMQEDNHIYLCSEMRRTQDRSYRVYYSLPLLWTYHSYLLYSLTTQISNSCNPNHHALVSSLLSFNRHWCLLAVPVHSMTGLNWSSVSNASKTFLHDLLFNFDVLSGEWSLSACDDLKWAIETGWYASITLLSGSTKSCSYIFSKPWGVPSFFMNSVAALTIFLASIGWDSAQLNFCSKSFCLFF